LASSGKIDCSARIAHKDKGKLLPCRRMHAVLFEIETSRWLKFLVDLRMD